MKKQRRNKKKQDKMRKARAAKIAAADAKNDLLLAMSHHRDGNFDAAKAYFNCMMASSILLIRKRYSARA